MDKRQLASYAYHNCEFVHAINLLKGEALSPQLAAVHVKSLSELDEKRAAVECANAYVEQFPGDGGLLYQLGVARYLAGEPRAAVEQAFLASAERHYEGAQIGLAFLEFAAARPRSAVELLRTARPTEREIEHVRLVSLFQALSSVHELPEAEDALRAADRVLAREPSLLRQYWGQLCWVRLLMAKGTFEGARAILSRILDQLDEHLMPRLHRNALEARRMTEAKDDTPNIKVPPERRDGPRAGKAELGGFGEIARKPMLHSLFSFLSGRGDRGATKEDIVTGVWEESYNPLVHDDRIYKAIGRLRKLLGDDQQAPRYLTQMGRSYILNLPARPESSKEST